MGVTVYPMDDADADTLLRRADQAMYASKQAGRNLFHLFDAEQDRQINSRRLQLDRVRQAATGHLVLGLEATRARMSRLGKNEITGGEILSADEVMTRFHDVTMDDLKRVSTDVLSHEKVLAVIGPFSEDDLQGLVAGGAA